MQFEPGQFYQVVEMPDGLFITASNRNVRAQGVEKLIAADGPGLIKYLDHYIAARQEGKTLAEAHPGAVQAASRKVIG